jgi:predicted DNA-binding protein
MRFKLGKRVNLYLAEIQIKRLKGLSQKTGLSVSEHVRRAIDEYLYKEKKKGG